MKTTLTIEQSQRLIELGISIDKASDSAIYDEPCHRAYMPIFTLTDLLGILPKKITIDGVSLSLKMEWCYKQQWSASYIIGRYFCEPFCHAELIDALYSLLIWLIENKHI